MPYKRDILSLHEADRVNGFTFLVIKIDGSALGTSLSTDGVVIGSRVCTAKDATEVVTITFNEPLRNAPIVAATQCTTADCIVKPDSITASTTSIVYSCYKISDATTAVNDADVTLTILIPGGSELT